MFPKDFARKSRVNIVVDAFNLHKELFSFLGVRINLIACIRQDLQRFGEVFFLDQDVIGIVSRNGKNADVTETQYNFTIINTVTEYYKYTLSKQLEELAISKRYNGKYLYYIKQIIFLFYRNNKVIVPFKLLVKKRIK